MQNSEFPNLRKGELTLQIRIAPWEFDQLAVDLDAEHDGIEDAWKSLYNLAKDMDSFTIKLVCAQSNTK